VSGRLSSLPLFLPSLSHELPPKNPTYLQVRYSCGRLYACRVYHQDELDAASWDDGAVRAAPLTTTVTTTYSFKALGWLRSSRR
jgi:hypothetical protein